MLLRSLFVLSLHCACALRLPDTIYITTPSSIEDEAAAAQSNIKTELVAPEASSLSQYYQQQNYQQPNFFQQPSHEYSPFLYTGPLILMEDQRKLSLHTNEKRNTERNTPSQGQSSYDLYRPSPQENPEFVDMLPPSQEQDETNYYAVIKPKKNKKYSAAIDGEKKKTAKKSTKKEKNVKDYENYDNFDDSLNENQQRDQPEVEVSSELTNDSQARRQREAQSNEQDKENDDDSSVERSAPTSRLDFAMHGHKGPDTYKYGYDSGKGKNRQFKIEEKDENGDVLGEYGFYDDKGKFRVVKYSVIKNGGFKVL